MRKLNPKWLVPVGLLAAAMTMVCGLLFARTHSAGTAQSVQDKPAVVEMQPQKEVLADGAVPGKAVMALRAIPTMPVAAQGTVLAKAVMAVVSPDKAVMAGKAN